MIRYVLHNTIAEVKNDFVKVIYDKDFTAVNCTFLTWPSITYGESDEAGYTCNIAYGVNKGQFAMGIRVDSNIFVLHLDAFQKEHRNFTITASCGNHSIYIDGTFIRNGTYTCNVIICNYKNCRSYVIIMALFRH